MTSQALKDWLSRQGVLPPGTEVFRLDASGNRSLTLMNLVFRDDYGLAHKDSVAVAVAPAVAPCPAESAATPLALSFDSHTNAFPEDFYLRIGITRAAFRAEVEATSCRIRILRRDARGDERIVAECEGQGRVTVDLPFDLQAGGSRCILRIDASPDLTLRSAAWTTPAPDEYRAMGVAMTTYDKEDFLRTNLQAILDSAPARAGLLEVLVVNNGGPLGPLPDGVTLVERGNIGGTGGFLAAQAHFRTRPLTHFLVMDDDILIAPDFLERAYAIACLARGVHVGAVAEVLNSPRRLIKEQGARVSRTEFLGLDRHNPDLVLDGPDLSKLYTLHPAEYSGWWALLVDLSATHSLPPGYFFIKRDDILFGVESALAGHETLVFPNLHVTHSEIGSATYFYYDLRNELILRARHAGELRLDLGQLWLLAKWCLVTLQPGFQRMFNLALRDFLRGPGYLAALDPQRRLAVLRRIAPVPVARPAGASVLAAEAGGQPERALHFLLPGSYRHDPTPPVIAGNPAGMVGRRSAYFGAIPWSDKVYPRRRRLSALLHYGQALVLLWRLGKRFAALQQSYGRAEGRLPRAAGAAPPSPGGRGRQSPGT